MGIISSQYSEGLDGIEQKGTGQYVGAIFCYLFSFSVVIYSKLRKRNKEKI